MNKLLAGLSECASSDSSFAVKKWYQPTPRKLLVVFLVLCFMFEGAFLLFSALQTQPRQGDLFMAGSWDFMADYLNVMEYSKKLAGYPPDNAERAYPPLCYVAFYWQRIICNGMLGDAPYRTVLFCMLFMAGSAVMFLGCAYRWICDSSTVLKLLFVAAIFFSGVFLSAFERGNLILLSVALVMFFLMFYRSRDPWTKELALLALAFSAGLKLSPAVFGWLLLLEKDYKSAIRLAIYGSVMIFAPFFALDGGLGNFPVMLNNLSAFTQKYIQKDFAYGRSAFEAMALWLTGGTVSFYDAVYPVLRGLALLGLLCTIQENRLWLRLFMLTAFVLQMPAASNFYNGLFIIPVVIVFLNNSEERWLDWVYVVLFAFLFSPLQTFVMVQDLGYVSITSVLQSIVFQVIFLLALGQTVALNARLLVVRHQQNHD